MTEIAATTLDIIERKDMSRPSFSIEQLGRLPEILEYTGEFGPELVLFLPFVRWLSDIGALRRHVVKTYTGMASFYDDLHYAGYTEKTTNRVFEHLKDRPRFLPNVSEYDFKPSPFYVFPDLRKKFRQKNFPALARKRPILVVHNKYNVEWSSQPINFLSEALLDRIFSATRDVFDVIYIRHKSKSCYRGYSWDHNTSIDGFDDDGIVNAYNHVCDFDKIYSTYSQDYDVNTFKNMLYANSHYFISSQGGGAHHLSYFSGSAFSIFHRQGMEMQSAYAEGLYQMTSNPAPSLLICLDEDDVIASLTAMIASQIVDDRVVFGTSALETLAQLSPARQRGIFYARENERRRQATIAIPDSASK